MEQSKSNISNKIVFQKTHIGYILAAVALFIPFPIGGRILFIGSTLVPVFFFILTDILVKNFKLTINQIQEEFANIEEFVKPNQVSQTNTVTQNENITTTPLLILIAIILTPKMKKVMLLRTY